MRLSEYLSECTQGTKPLFGDISGFMIEGHGFGCPRRTAQSQSRSSPWEPNVMAQCSTCGSTVPESVAVCPDCGMELKPASAPAAVTSPAAGLPPKSAPQPVPAPVPTPPASQSQVVTAGARLTLRRGGALSQEVFSLGSAPSIIGRFDLETGPVDLDLGPLPEAVYVSRHHAEIW